MSTTTLIETRFQTLAICSGDHSLQLLRDYATSLQHLVEERFHAAADQPASLQLWDAALDGGPRKLIQSRLSSEVAKSQGIFLTPSRLSTEMASAISFGTRHLRIVDPACGAGDLLLACASNLPLMSTAEETLSGWGLVLAGLDLHEELVGITRLRLALLAIRRHGYRSSIRSSRLASHLPKIKTGNGLNEDATISPADYVLMNPPYATTLAPADCDWAAGSVNSAAVFAWRSLGMMKPRSRLVALLPEVLRCGPRYSRWREVVGEMARIEEVCPCGLFDSEVDVEVFRLLAQVGESNKAKGVRGWAAPLSVGDRQRLSDAFRVTVGPVVPHRHKEEGPSVAYIRAPQVPVGEAVTEFAERRAFSGRVVSPPFVVVRRTSRPEARPRARTSVILGSEPVAVENHLIVLEPLDGREESCRALLEYLSSQQVTKWLNERSRCHHLTATLLRAVPLPTDLIARAFREGAST